MTRLWGAERESACGGSPSEVAALDTARHRRGAFQPLPYIPHCILNIKF